VGKEVAPKEEQVTEPDPLVPEKQVAPEQPVAPQQPQANEEPV
jgi:hypothetical protein